MGLRIRSVRAGWFRGFCEPQTITLDKAISIFYGPNGSGKSCVVEAIEWAVFGEIGRGVYAAHRQAYVGHRPVHNPRRPNDSATFVEILLDQDGSSRRLRRELVDLKRTRVLVDGTEVASATAALGIPDSEMLRPVISRHEGRVFLDAAPTTRWERVASLLGVEVFGSTREIVRAQIQELERDEAVQEVAALAREARAADLVQLADKMLASPYSAADMEAALLAAAAREGVAAENLPDAEEKLGLLTPVGRPSLPTLPSSEASAAAEELQKRLQELPEPSSSGDEARQAFLRAGIALSDPGSKRCPYCGEDTIDSDKRRSIEVEVESLLAAAEKEQKRTQAQSRFRTTLAKLPTTTDSAELSAACQRAGASQEAVGAFEEQLGQVGEHASAAETAAQAALDCAEGKAWRPTVEAARKAVEDLAASVEDLESREAALRSSIPGSPDRDLEAEKRREAIRRGCRERARIDRGGAARAVLDRLKRVAAALKEGERKAVRARLGQISDRVVQLYEKLNPGEKVRPTRLDVQDGERNEIKIKGETYGAEINPATTFSDGHLLCLSLALAIPYRADLNPTWDALLIDDPLFGIDPDHSARVADLIHELAVSGGKQIIVTSYYRRFVRDLENQGDVTTWEARPYSEEGILLEAQGDEIEVLVREAKTLLNGASSERRESGRKLREAFELLTERAAKQLDKARGQMRSKATVPERLERLEQLGIDSGLLGRLRSVGDRVGEASHAEDTDPSPTALQWCCEQIEELRTAVMTSDAPVEATGQTV